MRILALQLKRIGDLVLTAPALAALRRKWPEAHVALGAYGAATQLLGAFPFIDAGIAFGKDRFWAPWQQVLTGNYFDAVYDFTGNDRSAMATVLAGAADRVCFSWVSKASIRQVVYNRLVDSSVRERHTVDHYGDLVGEPILSGDERLRIPESVVIPELPRPFALIHPGTARPEKYWLTERWAKVIAHLHSVHQIHCVLTGGSDPFEQSHLAEIRKLAPPGAPRLADPMSLLTLAALAREARLVVSCDTAIVHLAAAFETPQVALFGPTNPFHWRPRHAQAVVLSAAQPEGPLTTFEPRAKGAPMDLISTELVIRATDSLLARSLLQER